MQYVHFNTQVPLTLTKIFEAVLLIKVFVSSLLFDSNEDKIIIFNFSKFFKQMFSVKQTSVMLLYQDTDITIVQKLMTKLRT